ncbi:MAG: nucleotidyltransferase family protein [Planctomycetes bacterium]|nr:nucleotidyltransferase family protein [Planctomycetota bacterium]
MNRKLRIRIPERKLRAFCRHHFVRRLSFFGSVVREDFGPKSDVDVLVEFERGHIPGLFGLAGMELELSALFGRRKVDLNTPGFFSPKLRKKIASEAQVYYAKAG